MNRFLISLEERFGFLAIPGILRYIMFLQGVVWLLMGLEKEREAGIGSWIAFSASQIQAGEWWRAFSFIAFPTGDGLLWVFLTIIFTIWIGDVIEHAWGSFRLNLYLLCSMLCVTAQGLLTGAEGVNSFFILEGLTMAFALYLPNIEIYLYGLIPLKMKWIGWMAAGYCTFISMIDSVLRWHIIASLIPFFLVFGPGFVRYLKNRGKVMERRSRMASASRGDHEPLSTCHVCGKTDITDPQLEFRVNAEGQDVCSECRTK
jgi:hypothetical protein